MANLSETVYLESAPAVDEAAGELRGVKLLGMESRNKRRYTREAMAKAVQLYEGRKIYIDHPKPSELDSDRSMHDWAGTIKAARLESDGIYGDVKLRKESQHFRGILEAARDFPKDVGFSHVADGESKFDNGTEIVESIRQVFSVDLVTDPATTGGFFESKRKPKTLKAAIESLPESSVRTKLVEMVGSGYIDGSASVDDEPADPMAALAKELIRMLGETLKALAAKEPVVQPPAPPAPEDDMDKEKEAAFESLQKEHATLKESSAKLAAEVAELNAKTLLLESGREATPARIKALANAEEADRKELLESWSVAEGGEERPARSPALLESEEGPVDFPRNDAAKFAASLR